VKNAMKELNKSDLGDLTIICGKETSELVSLYPNWLGDISWIEFPELYYRMHPSSQLEFARSVSKRVNSGEIIVLVTHSDYIVKEINLMLLISRLSPSVVCELGYSGLGLKASQIRNYVVEGGEIREIEAYPDGGFEFPSFDGTIDSMNDLHKRVWMLLDREMENRH
jgi:hypothetical protein